MDAPRPKRFARRLIFGAIIVYLVAGISIEFYRYIDDTRQDRRAAEWGQLAEDEAHSSMTQEDAMEWLRDRGFYGVRKGVGTRDAPGVHESYDLVAGTRQLSPRTWLRNPRWLELNFIFAPQSSVKRVDYDVRDYKVHYDAAES